MEDNRISPLQFNTAAELLGSDLRWIDSNGDHILDDHEITYNRSSYRYSSPPYTSNPPYTHDWYEGAMAAIRDRAKKLLVFPKSPLEPRHIFERDSSKLFDAKLPDRINEEALAKKLMAALPKRSKSCEEAEYARHVQEVFARLGVVLRMDDFVQRVGRLPEKERQGFYCNNGLTKPNSGNLIGFISASNPALPSWNLSFHLDTLQTAFDSFQREGDTIKSAPGTPLGADDKAGFAIIAEVVQVLLQSGVSHGDIAIVGLVGEEDTAGGARLIEANAFRGDILVSVDGTAPEEIGRAAPTMYKGYVEVRTQTSHPFGFDAVRSVSACAVAAQIKKKWFEPDGHPLGNPEVIFHSYFESCGDEFRLKGETQTTDFGIPMAFPRKNTVSPYATFAVQMRNLEGPEKSAELALQFKNDVAEICREASRGRTPVHCTVTKMDRPSLIGYNVAEDHAAVRLLRQGLEAVGLNPKVARQFGGFNGNYIRSRPDIGESTLLTGTGASELIHTSDETLSVRGMGEAARGLLAAMLESYRYTRLETP